MMEERKLFLLELVVDKIFFNFGPIPQKKQIVIRITCGTVLDSEIRTDVMGALEVHERDSKRMDVEICCGRSILFPIRPKELKELMSTCPLVLYVSTKLQTEPLGCVSIKWGQQFMKLMQLVEEGAGDIRGVHSNEFHSLKTTDDEVVGRVEVFHRLSYHGANVDTQIELVEEEDETTGIMSRMYYFKGEKNKTTYSCKKYGIGSDMDVVPVAPIYKTVDHVIDIDLVNFFNMSMATLRGSASTYSMMPSVFNTMSKMINTMISSTLSVDDSKTLAPLTLARLFLDIKNLADNKDSFNSFMESVTEINYKTLTVEKIEKMLCGNPDCPAAKKFKDYGIGPLAKGKGLGGLYASVEAPRAYGISQTRGNFQSYGPLGTLTKLKLPEKINSNKNGDALNSDKSVDSTDGEPLRLKGGSPEYFPDPKYECQDLMQQFNDVLGEFKNALGPCGEATCPFAHNLVDLTCKRVCHPERLSQSSNLGANPYEIFNDPKLGDEVSGCGVESCPYNREVVTPCDAGFKKKQLKAACGSPQCPFTREKMGLEDYDDVHMPKVACLENCPYKEKVDLPPIHWDCPDPLPEGDCKNPNCPIVRKEKLLEKYFPHPSSPCGSPTCPYAVVPCTFPHCPFAVPEPCPSFCPYAEPIPTELDCTPKNCPLTKPQELCEIPDCPYKSVPDGCDDTTCPFKSDDTTCALKSVPDECDDTTCPFKNRRGEDTSLGSESDKKGSICSVTSECPCGKKGNEDEKFTKDKRKSKTKSVGSLGKRSRSVVKNDDGKPGIGKEGRKRRKRRGKRKKRKCGYVYDQGTYYPGRKIGHRECVMPSFKVPADMGWLWNVHTKCLQLRPRRGWKPGAIGKTIAQRINEHRKKYGLKPINDTPVLEGKKSRRRRVGAGGYSSSSEEDVPMKPTLQVKKKNGVVYVTMNPLKDPKTLEENENPYMDCTPMQFKIVKNKPPKMCYCDEVEGEEKDLSEDSSELDIEFTPPAGVIRPERLKKKKNVCHVDVQYDVKDIPETPKEAKPGKGKKEKGKGKGKGKKK